MSLYIKNRTRQEEVQKVRNSLTIQQNNPQTAGVPYQLSTTEGSFPNMGEAINITGSFSLAQPKA
jgi:hypothetical protein